MRKAFALCLTIILFAAAALAHGGEEHLMGTVKKITGTSITIETKDKKTVEVTTAASTKFTKGEATAALKDIKVGDRVVIHAKKAGDKLTAVEVKIGVAAAPAAKQ